MSQNNMLSTFDRTQEISQFLEHVPAEMISARSDKDKVGAYGTNCGDKWLARAISAIRYLELLHDGLSLGESVFLHFEFNLLHFNHLSYCLEAAP
jgi:hypothetical protein